MTSFLPTQKYTSLKSKHTASYAWGFDYAPYNLSPETVMQTEVILKCLFDDIFRNSWIYCHKGNNRNGLDPLMTT